MNNRTDITGKKFGMLTVISRDLSFVHPKRTKWICQCECGNTKSIYRDSLISGRTKSCGCQMHKGKKGINVTHGKSKTRIYHEWASMKKRCKPGTKNDKNYYCRGISVCDEWAKHFEPFYDWAVENGYNDLLTLDRIDNDKGYSPDNCRWITIEEQQSNKTNNIYIEYKGKKKCLRSLCIDIGFPYKTAHRRYKKMVSKGNEIDTEKLFEPIHTEKIAFKYRKQD